MDEGPFYIRNAEHGISDEEIQLAAYFVWEREGRPDGCQERHWVTAIHELLVARIMSLKAAVRNAQPQNLLDVWKQLRKARHTIQVATENDLQLSLLDRPDGGRDQAADNKFLAPLSDTINRAIELGDYRLAAATFRDGYAVVSDYEVSKGDEIHKGAITFDIARAYLQSWDFYAAMHYFEFSEFETRKTTGDSNFNIYSFDLFEKNFWDTFNYGTDAYPNDAYKALWGIDYDKSAAMADYGNLSSDSRLAYVIACSMRLRLQHVEAHSKWNGSNALRLGYWTIAADLARMLEVEANRTQAKPVGGGLPTRKTIVPCLEEGFRNTAFGDLSNEMRNVIRVMFPRKHHTDPAPTGCMPEDYYEAAFDPILASIKDTTRSQPDRLAHSLYLLGFTRNQVAHRIDSSTRLFQQLNDAKYLVDLFIALCRINEWKAL